MVRVCVLLLCLTFMAALATAKKDHSLDDLMAEETSADESRRRVIHNSGDDESASAHLISQRTRTRKVVRQSRPADTIRTVQKSIKGYVVRQASDKAEAQERVDAKNKGGGNNKSDEDDEDRKTLSQQVADGKYGLIQAEIFNTDLQRPGIISYEVNPEVPKDNVNNLGGLRPEDIWLAENHLLVLSGGGFQQKEHDTPLWPPIDSYVAPLRQVKIPTNPKVPPPFPVQLKEGGPIEFIRNENGTGGPPPLPPFFPPTFPPPDGNNSPGNVSLYPYPPPNFNPGNFSPGNGPFLLPPPPFPFFPPPGSQQNGSLFLPPPGFFPGIPPGAAFLPPPGNLTDQFDEDDPSLYYPPPYDFYYPKDNSSIVPPGPLVPGIVLPPPPNFFAPLSNTTTSKSQGSGTRHPTKHKPTTPAKTRPETVLTTTETPTVHTVTDNYNLLTTPVPGYYTTDLPTIPTYPTTTDNSFNEITPPPINHVLPPNAVIQDWVPIPAPRPFYITGPRKPLKKGSTTTLPPDYNSVSPPSDYYLNGYEYKTPKTQQKLPDVGWIYPNKTKTYDQELQYFKEIPENPKDYYDYYPGPNPGYNQYLTQSLLLGSQRNIKPSYNPLRKGQSSTLSPTDVYRQPETDARGKSLKTTYYFYEEPHILESHLTDTDDIKYEDASYSTTPAPPRQFYNPVATRVKTPQVDYDTFIRTTEYPNIKGSDVSYYYPESYESVKPQSSSENPLNYFYIPENPKPSQNNVPSSAPGVNSGGKEPVYEYSFTAPGYSNQPSKIGTPAKPIVSVEQSYNPPVPNKSPQYNYYEYQSTPKIPTRQNLYDYNQPVFTTISPIKDQYFTTAVPGYQDYSSENLANAYYTTPKPEKIQQQTENPYHAFFTQQDAGLIDDITKKYFTVFGQKLSQDSIGGEPLTTPLPPTGSDDVARKAYYPQSTPRPLGQPLRTINLKFPNQQFQSGQIYYTTPATPYRQGIRHQQTKPSQQYSRPIYSYSYGDNAQSLIPSQRKPISLESDILVNYKEPLPPINPDAEFIDPNTPNIAKPEKQSLISYSLPGNGGHFYFLTPQAVQSQKYQNYDDDGYVYPSPVDTNQGYYKRNVRTSPETSPQQRRIQQQQSPQ